MPSIDWNSPWPYVLIGFFALSLAIHAGSFTAIAVLLFRKVKSNVRKDLQALSDWLKKYGASTHVTQIVDDAASGDIAATMGDEIAAIRYFSTPTNAATEWSNILVKVWNDPNVGPAVQATVTKLQGGAQAADLVPGLTSAITAGRASLPVPQIVSDFRNLRSKGVATLDNLKAALGSNVPPQLASLLDPILAEAHAAGAASVAGAVVAPPGTKAPAAAVAGTVAGVLAAGNAIADAVHNVSVPAGSVVTVNTPSVAPAPPAAAA